MIFSSIERDVVIAEKNERKLNGTSTEEDFGLGNLTKELGVRWRNLRPEEKQGIL